MEIRERKEEEHKKNDVPRVLIVDDISFNVEILENIIQAEGYEPLGALNVQEALDIMKDTMPQLILSDISMPGVNGVEFCRLVKSDPRTRDIPFVFITAANSSEEKREAFEAGASDYIPKPFERVEVIARVNNQLDNYRLRQEMEDYNRMIHKRVVEQKRQMEKERENILLALARVADKRDGISSSHIERIGYNCRRLAQSLQLLPEYDNVVTDEFVENIEVAAKLLDIGKIILSAGHQTGAGQTEEERQKLLREHTEEGAAFLEDISRSNGMDNFLKMAVEIARYHHAHWDGSGVPDGTGGRDIPLAARITSVVNGFDLSLWQYSVEESMDMIAQKSGTFYEPRIVEVFLKIKKQLKIGK